MENSRESLDVFPSDQDFFSTQTPCPQRNIIFGKYEDTEHYLNVHFNLLREDLIAPLREALNSFSRNDSSYKSALELYDDVKYLHKMTTLNEIAVIIQIGNQSRRKAKLKPGSLIILSKDNFQSLVFGKILDSLPKKNQFVVLFPHAEVLKTETSYKMLLSKNYYEPYYHVLKALKQLKAVDFPLKMFLVDVSYIEKTPDYLKNHSDVRYKKFSEYDKLNKKQAEAVWTALSNKFSVIQGPPGTGKTFIGIEIVKNLLKNQSFWHKAPILIISYTNQALDQYLEGLLDETKEIIRVGERSKNHQLKYYSLKNSVKKYFNKNKLVNLLEVKRELDNLYYSLFMVYSGRGIVKFDKFVNYHPDFKSSWFIEAADDDIIDWLLTGVEMFELHAKQNNLLIDEIIKSYEETQTAVEISESEEEIFDVPFYERHEKLQCKDLIELDEIFTEISRLKKLKTLDEDSKETLIRYKCLLIALHGSTKHQNLSDKYTSLANAEYMDPEKRWKLYDYWRKRYVVDLLEKIEKTEQKFQVLSQNYQDYRDELNIAAMREKLVVGMTTTCAARMQKTLENLQCPIVIVEEAAFVLESHIITALSSNCQQLILLGDHKQLRPRVSHLSMNCDINTEISLFERMILNCMPHISLDTQYRMRPEITRLISPSIYPNLINEAQVELYRNVPGLEKPVYFFDHKYFEAAGSDSSKENVFEADFVVRLAKYLVLNGCNGREVSVLAAYKKQVERIKEIKQRFQCLGDVEVSTFDEFQGQENGIVLLSLVRSNREGKIGFLGLVNRISVALSRAKFGFYLIGNMDLLSQQSEIWEKIKQELLSMQAIDGVLHLQCAKHGRVTEVSRAEDFPEVGGCNLDCREILVCRHVCRRKCHPMPHEDLNCEQCESFKFHRNR